MIRTLIAAAGALALALGAAPAAAQMDMGKEPTADELAAMGSLFADMFGEAEPLTAEQEERVPLAMQLVTKLLPEGTMAKMMEETMAPMMDGMMGGFGGSDALTVSQLTGFGPLEFAEVDDKRLEEALSLLDPDAEERNSAMTGAFVEMISEVVIEVEPSYRSGLARAYAIRFTKEELADLDAYFATPIGSKYAAESYLIFADPQVMSSMNEMMPAMMQRMPTIMETITEVTEKFPQGRSFSDLTEAEQARLANLLGVSVDDLAANEPPQPDAELKETLEKT